MGAGLLLLTAAVGPAAAAEALAAPVSTNLTVSAAELKVVFLYNFTRFVKWPEHTQAEPDAPIVIGIQDPEPVRESLHAIEKKTTHGRPVRIRYCRNADDVDGCHVLFVNAADAKDRRPLLEKAANQSILTVGDADSFLEEGGIVRFVLQGDRLRLQIRLKLAQQAGLDLDARLLQIAEIIHDDKP